MKTFSKFISNLTEKGLSNFELDDLIDRAKKAAEAVVDDDEKTSEEKSRASEILDWISDVEETFSDEGKLHPNTVNGLMRIVTGANSGRYGWTKKGDGKVPSNYSR